MLNDDNFHRVIGHGCALAILPVILAWSMQGR